MSIVGTRIKQVREQRGLTQKDLANRIHKSPATVSAYEVGMQTPPTDVLLSIARVLHVPITYLAGQTSDNGISALHLNAQQKEVLDLLMGEFTTPTGNGEDLSPQQVKIIRRLPSCLARRTINKSKRSSTGLIWYWAFSCFMRSLCHYRMVALYSENGCATLIMIQTIRKRGRNKWIYFSRG